MSDPLEAARAALRERQGSGARHDAANAPHRELDWARRGTAYFARMLNGLSDADLDGPSAVPGSLRRVVVAHAGYHARALSEVVSRARQGVCDRVAGSLLVDDGEIEVRATQPAHALRNLFSHASVHLNVEWRDLADEHWDVTIYDEAGHEIAIRRTPWLRARAIWLFALDLGAGGTFRDLPPGCIDALIRETKSSSASVLPSGVHVLGL